MRALTAEGWGVPLRPQPTHPACTALAASACPRKRQTAACWQPLQAPTVAGPNRAGRPCSRAWHPSSALPAAGLPTLTHHGALPRPGGDAWARVDLEAGEAEFELTDRGWISYLNDLHKGRNTGKAWSWFIDIFAAACLVFCLTGFFILKMHATKRPFTWPMVGMGLVIPVVLALLFIH